MIKKKDLSEKDKETWETYIKNPSDVYDKDKNNQKNQDRKERFRFDLHGHTLDAANQRVRDIIFSCVKQNHEILEGKDKKEFLKGAEIAYETILTAFAKGEVKKLKSLLTSTMNDNFSGAIDVRNKENIKSEFTFIGVKESSVEKYEKVKDDLFANVKFVAEVISVKRDKDNKIIEGSPDKIKFVTDIWKFTKNIKNKSPNWYLAEIISQ